MQLFNQHDQDKKKKKKKGRSKLLYTRQHQLHRQAVFRKSELHTCVEVLALCD